MNQKFTYSNHVKHYQNDAEFSDYFQNNKFNEQVIRRRYEEFVHLYTAKKGDCILEIGSGGGQALEVFDTREVKYVPLDISIKNVKTINDLSENTILPVTGDAFFLPFSSESFDLIILSEVLEHLDKPAQALAEAHRVLKTNGILLVSVPYNETISYHLCIHCNKPTPVNAHLHSFTEHNLTEMLSYENWQVVSINKGCNKASNRLHFNIITRSLPFKLWNIFDSLANLIIPKPTYMTIKASKSS